MYLTLRNISPAEGCGAGKQKHRKCPLGEGAKPSNLQHFPSSSGVVVCFQFQYLLPIREKQKTAVSLPYLLSTLHRAGHFAAGIACFDTKLQCFVTFPRAEAFSPRAKLPGGMWTGTRVTGHAAVPCVRGLLFVGGLSADEDPTMRAWVLDVVTGRWRVGKGFSKSVAKRQTAGGCGIN